MTSTPKKNIRKFPSPFGACRPFQIQCRHTVRANVRRQFSTVARVAISLRKRLSSGSRSTPSKSSHHERYSVVLRVFSSFSISRFVGDSEKGSIGQLVSNYVATVGNDELTNRITDEFVALSRTRRMCRLLVDCDTSLQRDSTSNDDDDEQLHEGGKGLDLLSRCWKRLVRRHTNSFLSAPTHATSPHDVANSLCSLYEKLRKSMTQLFGNHGQFAVALNEGLADAFKALNEIKGVEVILLRVRRRLYLLYSRLVSRFARRSRSASIRC